MLQPTIQWPPDYTSLLLGRQQLVLRMQQDPKLVAQAFEFYREYPIDFIEQWCTTYDPRNVATGRPPHVPFILFPRQREFIDFLQGCIKAEANGLVEKSRDMGATWLCCAFSVWLFLFVPGSSIGWGSRKADLVDRIGVMDSIFEKMRFLLRDIPHFFWPEGFKAEDMAYMKITAQSTGSSISGESGDDIGRGGRTLIYFKDESAHYEHPEAIEAALAENTRVQIDISSVNGLGNVFHRKREAGIDWEPGAKLVKGKTNVFVMDWSDHPLKTKAWYDEKENEFTSNGLAHIFRQEVDRSYDAAIEGVIVPAVWVRSAIDAHLRIKGMDEGGHCSGLDVADDGGDRNALAVRKGVVLLHIDEWGERDTALTARRAVSGVEKFKPLTIQYDSVGVGAGVKAEANRLIDEKLMPQGLRFIAWNAGSAVRWPDKRVIPGDLQSPLNKDFYLNLKAQGWWQLRRRFELTHRAITEGVKVKPSEMISISSKLPKLRQLQKELSQPVAGKTANMKLKIEKMPEGTRSPNIADAVMMCYWPLGGYDSTMSWVS